MTVKQLKELIKDKDPEMIVVMPHWDNSYITVCNEKSSETTIETDDGEVTLMLLLPCDCSASTEDINMN